MKSRILFAIFVVAPFAALASEEVKVSVKGMVCGFCAQGITKKLKSESAVDKVDVSLESKIVKIDLKDGENLSDSAIEGILKDAGYNVEKIDRK